MVDRPKISDNDKETITVSVNGEPKMKWVYADDTDRLEKMRHAYYFCDGYLCALGRPLLMKGIE